MQKLVIKGSLTDLNTYINLERTNKFMASKIKKEETERVAWECKAQKLKPVSAPPYLVYCWYCKDKKKDKSNVAFSRKFIEDGLVMAGILKNDGWDNILGYADKFDIDKQSPRIEVYLI